MAITDFKFEYQPLNTNPNISGSDNISRRIFINLSFELGFVPKEWKHTLCNKFQKKMGSIMRIEISLDQSQLERFLTFTKESFNQLNQGSVSTITA